MSERKLRAGYVWLKAEFTVRVIMDDTEGRIPVRMPSWNCEFIGRVSDGECWKKREAPAECFESAEPARPKPKFAVGQWAEHKLTGLRFVCDFPIREFPAILQLTGPISGLTVHEGDLAPCSPVCTEAQLAIRVGDEVRVAHQWDHDGMVYMIPQTPKLGAVSTVTSIESTDLGIMVETVDDECSYLWNLEPVKPRA
jgi:hypothetical protein